MTYEELCDYADEHRERVWGDDSGEYGAGDLVLSRFGIDLVDATMLAIRAVQNAIATHTVEGQSALVMQGFIFGLWLAERLAEEKSK